MLLDCSPINITDFAKAYFGNGKRNKEAAIEWLLRLAKANLNDGHLFKLTNSGFENEPIVYTDRLGQWWTGRYIGSLHFEGVSIEIMPRFGMSFIANNIPLNNFIAAEANASISSGDKFIHFLQAMLWLNLLAKAGRHTLPTVRLERKHISTVSRGKIDVRGTVTNRLRDKSNITSISSYKDINNPVTVAIVLAFLEIQRWFPEHNLLHWMPSTIALRLQQMIGATPRHAAKPALKEIKKVRLKSISKGYTALAKLSLDILNNKGVTDSASDSISTTLLLDVAELWELYILAVLKEVHEGEIDVIHGTTKGDLYLLTDLDGKYTLGKLLPDYILSRNGREVAVGDAKYKRLGDQPWMSPKRDDLYQMTAYLSRYSECQIGSLYYPDWGETSRISENNPWKLKSGQLINFISVPIVKSEAVALLRNLDISSNGTLGDIAQLNI